MPAVEGNKMGKVKASFCHVYYNIQWKIRDTPFLSNQQFFQKIQKNTLFSIEEGIFVMNLVSYIKPNKIKITTPE